MKAFSINKLLLLLLFLITGILFCISVFLEVEVLINIFKPIPLLLLIFSLKPDNKYSALLLVGFIFSVLGDIFLLKSLDLFLFGLSSFLIAHIFYIIAFIYRFKRINLMSSIPFYLAAISLIYVFYPYLGDMLIPVIIYIMVIITMVWRAYLQRNFDKMAIYAFIGASLFAVSDSNIALTKFIHDYNYSLILTIILYWTAQYFIYLSSKKS